jgi:protein-tyrosine phosphatase
VQPYTYEELFPLPPDDHPMGDDDHQRIIPLEGADNLRDLGGYTTADGRRVRWGRLYRAGRLDALTQEDITTLAEMNITTVCDFRTAEERQAMPDRLPPAAEHKIMPVFEEDPVQRWRVLVNRHRLLDLFAEVYTGPILEGGAETYGELIRLAAAEENLPLLFHCTAGKDRTGVAAALILLVLGVDRATVINDYLLTNHTADVLIAEVAHQLGARNVRGVTVEQIYPLLAAAPALIEAALAHIDEHYGGAEGYLRQRAGVSAETLDRLRQLLLA